MVVQQVISPERERVLLPPKPASIAPSRASIPRHPAEVAPMRRVALVLGWRPDHAAAPRRRSTRGRRAALLAERKAPGGKGTAPRPAPQRSIPPCLAARPYRPSEVTPTRRVASVLPGRPDHAAVPRRRSTRERRTGLRVEREAPVGLGTDPRFARQESIPASLVSTSGYRAGVAPRRQGAGVPRTRPVRAARPGSRNANAPPPRGLLPRTEAEERMLLRAVEAVAGRPSRRAGGIDLRPVPPGAIPASRLSILGCRAGAVWRRQDPVVPRTKPVRIVRPDVRSATALPPQVLPYRAEPEEAMLFRAVETGAQRPSKWSWKTAPRLRMPVSSPPCLATRPDRSHQGSQTRRVPSVPPAGRDRAAARSCRSTKGRA